ncbi:hypothetical protein GCM10007862_11930 [Dyella lipolytica]|nr:hypothetical protein GCM10007862_11930 [Dyella lipolytica]
MGYREPCAMNMRTDFVTGSGGDTFDNVADFVLSAARKATISIEAGS